MSSPSISKIHVTNTTGLSLNERFTAIASEPVRRPPSRSRSRSRSRGRQTMPRVDRATSMANTRLLRQLARKHTMQTALKLKRRSLKATGTGGVMKRGSIKSLRVGPNGRPISANTMARVATMKADMINNGRGRTLRRTNSRANAGGNRLGLRRPVVGGAAERVASRRLKRFGNQTVGVARQSRPRSRSRARQPVAVVANVRRGRSASRGRVAGRGRPRSVSRGRNYTGARAIPIKDRLGMRPRDANATGKATNIRGRMKRRASISRRGVTAGRIEKNRPAVAQSRGKAQIANGVGRRMSRARGRAVVKSSTVLPRSRSRTRKVSVGQVKQPYRQQQGQVTSAVGRGRRRGRSQVRTQVRNGRGGGQPQRNGKANIGSNGQQAVRGRSRSRAGRASRGRRGGRGGGRNLGKSLKGGPVNKDDLDKELDQYMATTKTENDMDYLLKN